MPLSTNDSGSVLFKIKAKALNFVYEELGSAALVRGCILLVVCKLNDRLETGDGGGNFWLDDTDEVGSVDFGEVDDNWLRSNGHVSRLTDVVSEGRAEETLF